MSISITLGFLFLFGFFGLSFLRFDRFKPNRYLLVGSIYLMFLLALVLRLWLVWHNDGYVTDKHIFQNWALKANQLGFQDFYYANMFLDYPPGYVYVLMGIDKLLETWNIGFFVPFASFMFAIPSVLCDLVTGAMVLYIGTKKIDMLHGMFFSASYLFCPAVFVNSAMWQQVDAWPTMFLFISVWFLYEEKYVVSGSLYGLALISKPQMLTFVPVYLYFCLKDRKFRELGKGVGCVVLSILLVALPFTRGLNFLWLVDLYRKTMGSYNFYTLNAYNFWGMFHMNSSELPIDWQKGVLTVVAPAVACAVGALLYFGSKRKDTLFAVPVVLQGITFLFGVKMHERYMFPLYVFSLVCCIVLGSRLLFGLHLSLCTLNYLNVANVLGGELVVLHSMGVRLDVEWWLSVLQVFIFIVMLVVLFVSFIGKESGDVCFSVTAVED